MVIRPFVKENNDNVISYENNLRNLKNKSRTILIYKNNYFDNVIDKYKAIYGIYPTNYKYEIYIINESLLIGKDIILPKNKILFTDNRYVAISNDIITSKGEINYNAQIIITSSNHISKLLSKKDSNTFIEFNSFDYDYPLDIYNDFTHLKDPPNPIFYTQEDEYIFGEEDYEEYYSKNYHMINFSKLIDTNTKIYYIDLEKINHPHMKDKSLYKKFLYTPWEYRSINEKDLTKEKCNTYEENVKDLISELYIETYSIFLNSIFKRGTVVYDLFEQTFNIPIESISIKESYKNIFDKKQILKFYTHLCEKCSYVFDFCDVFQYRLEDYKYFKMLRIPNRIYININETMSSIQLSPIRDNYRDINYYFGKVEMNSIKNTSLINFDSNYGIYLYSKVPPIRLNDYYNICY